VPLHPYKIVKSRIAGLQLYQSDFPGVYGRLALESDQSKTVNSFKLPVVTDDYFKIPYSLSENNVNVNIGQAPQGFDSTHYC
jgi:hypothetical protein